MIYVITHKAFDDSIVPAEGYRVLHVGMNDNSKANYLRDDTGNNISSKNPYYCELTGLYWIWKNSKEKPDDIVGLVHYRRFFTVAAQNFKYALTGKMPQICGVNRLEKECNGGKVLLPKRLRGLYSLEVAYAINHSIEDLRKTQEAIQHLTPEYIDDYHAILRSNVFFGYNMMVCNKKMLDQYCEWLFPILSYVEELKKDEPAKNTYQDRAYAFISERLLQVWLKHNNVSIAELPVFNTERRSETFIVSQIKRLKAIKLRAKRRKADNIDDMKNKKYHI